MGNHYGNHVVLFDNLNDSIDEVLLGSDLKGYRSNVLGNEVYLYDYASDFFNKTRIVSVGQTLSSKDGHRVIAFANSDDDYSGVWFFRSGRLVGCSSTEDGDELSDIYPHFFLEEEVAQQIRNILIQDFVFVFEQHQAIAELLGLEGKLCVTGAHYIDRHLKDKMSDGLNRDFHIV